MNDNRNYVYKKDGGFSLRPEYSYIENWITSNAKVIDLGCGDGSLLALLKKEKNVTGFGIDISESAVVSCLEKGIEARVGRIDIKLKELSDDSFDFAICNVTLQMVMYPE